MAEDREALRQAIDELLESNGKLEEELHAKGACTDAILSQLRLQAFIDAVVDGLGLRLEFTLALEKQRADAAASILSQLDRAKLAVPGGAVPLRPDGRL